MLVLYTSNAIYCTCGCLVSSNELRRTGPMPMHSRAAQDILPARQQLMYVQLPQKYDMVQHCYVI